MTFEKFLEEVETTAALPGFYAVRLTAEQSARVRALSELSGLSMSTFIRWAIQSALPSTIVIADTFSECEPPMDVNALLSDKGSYPRGEEGTA